MEMDLNTVNLWLYEVANGDTHLGYAEWLIHRRESEARFDIEEIRTIYVDHQDRWVVSLVVGYGDSIVTDARTAAAAALNLTTDQGSSDTVWFVWDRKEKVMHQFEQGEFVDVEVL